MDNRCFIEFKVDDIGIFNKINNLFIYISNLKKDDIYIDDLDEKVFQRIDDFYTVEELNYFWWPSQEENREFWNKYNNLSQDKRAEYLDAVSWDFESVFSEIGTGEYTIEECELVDKNRGRVYFNPISWPYGGNKVIQEVIRSFGAEIIEIRG